MYDRLKNGCTKSFLLAHFLWAVLVVAVFFPSAKPVESSGPFVVALILGEVIYLCQIIYKKNSLPGNGDLASLIWGILLLWEVLTSKWNVLHPVLFPAPENVFHVFAVQYKQILTGVLSSMELLILGLTVGIGLSVIFGLMAGWNPRLHRMFFPIAQLLAPISPVIYAPYLIALMPTFRSASFLVIFLGVFWPGFLNIILRVDTLERRLLDSARSLNVSNLTMIFSILLPFVIPVVVSGLRVTVATSLMMLTFAEMMGATSGMGYYIINYVHYANYTNVAAGIMVMGVVVTILNHAVIWIQRYGIKWR